MATEQFEDYQNEMYETFQALGTKPAEWKWNGQDPEENRGPGGVPAGQCKLCGKHPIAYEFTIVHMGEAKNISGNGFVGIEWVEGTSKGLKLIVGSECVAKYVEAAPYSQKRRAKDAMKRLTMLNKMTNYLVEKKSVSYEEARKEADEMTSYQIKAFFGEIQRARSAKKLKIRAAALCQLMKENYSKLLNVNWDYMYRRRTILSSLNYMKQTWEQGRETPYMEGPMNGVLAPFGLALPAKPKLAELEEQ